MRIHARRAGVTGPHGPRRVADDNETAAGTSKDHAARAQDLPARLDAVDGDVAGHLRALADGAKQVSDGAARLRDGGRQPVDGSGRLRHGLPPGYAVDGVRHLVHGGSLGGVGRYALVLVAHPLAGLALATLAAYKQRVWTPSRLKPELAP